MSSNYMQEAGLGIKNYSFLCQAVSTFADVLIMALQSYIQTNPWFFLEKEKKKLIFSGFLPTGTSARV